MLAGKQDKLRLYRRWSEMVQKRQILVVEKEALLALDLQRMLEGGGTASITVARTAHDVVSIGGPWPGIELAIIETGPDAAGTAGLIDQLRAAGIPVLATTAGSGDGGLPAGIPVLRKPILEADLLAACAALIGAPSSGAES